MGGAPSDRKRATLAEAGLSRKGRKARRARIARRALKADRAHGASRATGWEAHSRTPAQESVPGKSARIED